jgi:hypothetical protein
MHIVLLSRLFGRLPQTVAFFLLGGALVAHGGPRAKAMPSRLKRAN